MPEDISIKNQSFVATDEGHPEEESVLRKTESSEDDPVEIQIILPTNAYFLSGVREFTMKIAENITGFSPKWAYRFQSVVDELTNNAIEFGSAQGEKVEITFISIKGKQIEIYVKDTGTGPNKKTAEEMRALVAEKQAVKPADMTSIRGRGLAQIVSNWTDQLEFMDNEKGGLTIHVVKKITKENS